MPACSLLSCLSSPPVTFVAGPAAPRPHWPPPPAQQHSPESPPQPGSATAKEPETQQPQGGPGGRCWATEDDESNGGPLGHGSDVCAKQVTPALAVLPPGSSRQGCTPARHSGRVLGAPGRRFTSSTETEPWLREVASQCLSGQQGRSTAPIPP